MKFIYFGKKKISFSNDVKKYDGSSYKNIVYSEIISDLLNLKINTKNDILNKTKNNNLIYYFLIETYNVKNKLEELKFQYEKNVCKKIPAIIRGSRDIIYKINIKHINLLNKLIEILEDI